MNLLRLLMACVDIPRNCTECEYARGCDSWYGGTKCRFRDEIGKK